MTVVSNESKIAKAMNEVFVSPNESDSNMEPANVVDGLFEIARALWSLSKCVQDGSKTIANSLDDLAEAIRDSRNDDD